RRVRPVLVVVACRPPGEPVPAGYRDFLKLPGLRPLRLGALPRDSVLALVSQRLDVAELPGPVADLIVQKAQGNPFYSVELAYALRDAGLIVADGGGCRLAPDVDLETVAVPESVQGVIVSRIDRLAPGLQLALKVASVIGRAFAYRVLCDVYPVE